MWPARIVTSLAFKHNTTVEWFYSWCLLSFGQTVVKAQYCSRKMLWDTLLGTQLETWVQPTSVRLLSYLPFPPELNHNSQSQEKITFGAWEQKGRLILIYDVCLVCDLEHKRCSQLDFSRTCQAWRVAMLQFSSWHYKVCLIPSRKIFTEITGVCFSSWNLLAVL